MKKILFALTLGCSSLAALNSCAMAQNAVKPVAFNDAKVFKTTINNMAILESPAFIGEYVADEKKINAKAIKDFETRFNSAGHAMWFTDKNGFVSYFIKDGYGDRAFYDKKGHWQYSLIFYGEDKLPRDVRTTVKSKYFDMAITLVEEVQTVNGTGYVIHLEDKSNIRIVKVNREGEMETMQDLTKE
jgi:hypothetical protein